MIKNYTKEGNIEMNTKENENLKKFSLYERIILKLHRRLFEKIYKMGITFGFNNK